VQPEGGVHFRVWAPDRQAVAVEFMCAADLPASVPLQREPGGYFSGCVREARAGTLYKYRLDAGAFPDPASRFQPDGPHGPSQVVDPGAFEWTDRAWRGAESRGQVIYELHLGTFTREGTWRAARERLPELRELGVTMLEVMPVADFAGAFGWGYDGVDLFAPSRLYGSPDDARAFVDRAHALGLSAILDVVYNHLGPDGNYLAQFAMDYFHRAKKTEWGEAINFDGENCGPVREFFVANACAWIDEFHCDGLRFDATQSIYDHSARSIVAEISEATRAAAGDRSIYLVAENEPQHTRLLRAPDDGGGGMDALWNDDFHHSAFVAASGRAEAYYSDYRGVAQEFVSALKQGFLFQGQWCRWQQKRRGSPTRGVGPHRFVVYLQNHDQVANALRGQRLHELASPGVYRALTAVLLLGPQTPLLFQGQEFAASAPFLYFADHAHAPDLRDLVRDGRWKFLRQFPSVACTECADVLADPGARATFERCKLDWAERESHAAACRLHADLLRVRREDRALAAPEAFDGAVLGRRTFVVRWFDADGDDRLLVVNLDDGLLLGRAPEPLLAPPEQRMWHVAWSSEAPIYGGNGTPPLETRAGWRIPARAAVLLQPGEMSELPEAVLHEGA
jgi:maltooligosyltrehalose trehalohydrolase